MVNHGESNSAHLQYRQLQSCDDGDEEEEEDGYDNDDTLEVLKHDETILWIARFPSISSAMGQIQKLPHVEANTARVHLSHWRHPPVIAQLGDIGNVGPYIANIAVLCCFQFLSFVVILCQKTIEINIYIYYIILYIYISQIPQILFDHLDSAFQVTSALLKWCNSGWGAVIKVGHLQAEFSDGKKQQTLVDRLQDEPVSHEFIMLNMHGLLPDVSGLWKMFG